MRITAVLCAAAVLIFSGCAKNHGRELLDRSGRKVTVTKQINRIISTAPSNTEIIADIGMADKLVAVDKYSSGIEGLPGGLVSLDFFYPDAEAIIRLEPDIIIANGHNATGTGNDPLQLLREAGIPVAYVSMSKSINDIYEDIAFIADLLGVKENGDALISGMKARIGEISGVTAHIENKRSVYFEISAAPEMFTFGKDSFINDMITAVNGRNIFENDNWIVTPSAEVIIDRNPDVILTTVDYLDDPIEELKTRPGFEHTGAVTHNRVYQIDTNSSVRPSARITRALEQMSRAVYPEAYKQ